MENKNIITRLVLALALLAALATLSGIFSGGGPGRRTIESVRGQAVTLYGRGLYQDMSAEVAIQGIAQDWVTLLFAIPALLASLYLARKDSRRGLLALSGVSGYFLVTYLLYLAMAMYNRMFLVYAALVGLSFFALLLCLFALAPRRLEETAMDKRIFRAAGRFLMLTSTLIALLWLSVIVPPLFSGGIPLQVAHYTTLIVQGFDLALFLPSAFVSGWLAVRGNRYGYLFATVNVVLLSLLMSALVAKILFMAAAGQNVIPVIFIIPVIDLAAIYFALRLLRSVREDISPS